MFASARIESVDRVSYFQTKLREYLLSESEVPLKEAYELGQKNMADGLGLLDQTSVHQQALTALLEDQSLSDEQVKRRLTAAHRVLNEALSPFESARLVSDHTKKAVSGLIAAMEKQSSRIAHRLHDECSQMLAVVFMELAEISRNCSDSNAVKIQEVVGHLESVCEQMREISHELRPVVLDQLGFGPALRMLAIGVSKRAGFRVILQEDYTERLDPIIEVALYRTVQEALANVNRHAKASSVTIRVWVENDTVCCKVVDDGVGFEMNDEKKDTSPGLGLLGVQERVLALGGECRIVSVPEKGTELQVNVPL